MESGNNESKNGNGTESGDAKERIYEDRRPIQFVQCKMSQDGKHIFVDTVSRVIFPINYVLAIHRNKMAALAQAQRSQSPDETAPAASHSASGKTKRARKENDRTT